MTSPTAPAEPALTPPDNIRIARPTNDLEAAEHFWVIGLGLSVLWQAQTAQLIAVGWPTAAWHLELVEDRAVTPRPTIEDLLVLYLARPIDNDLTARLEACGGTVVDAHNPYWDANGVTVADPDGYRLVLSQRAWHSPRHGTGHDGPGTGPNGADPPTS